MAMGYDKVGKFRNFPCNEAVGLGRGYCGDADPIFHSNRARPMSCAHCTCQPCICEFLKIQVMPAPNKQAKRPRQDAC
eukprot:6157133-Pyramimonas_sp.AAC.1